MAVLMTIFFVNARVLFSFACFQIVSVSVTWLCHCCSWL